MLQSSPSESGLSIPLIEGSLTLIAVAASFAWPQLGDCWFARAERALGKLARRKRLSVAVVGLSVVLLRLALLPLLPIPLPFVPDDFSFLLAADTFAHGRLTNPTPDMWIHFESIHIDMMPTYMSMYFPGPGLLFAGSEVLFGHPWYGLLIVNALMCAAICWMLQAWLPPAWAFLGGMLVVLRISLFSYWINTYTGGGALAALGGALVLGSLPRFMRHAQFRHAMLMAAGIVLLAYTRPYEGMLLCLPVAAALIHWLFKGKHRPITAILVRRNAAPLALLIIAAVWLGYYDYRAFGSPFTLPYTVNRATYARVPYYIWQPLRPEPVYHHLVMRRFYDSEDYDELAVYKDYLTWTGTFKETLIKITGEEYFFVGFTLLPPLFLLRRVWSDRRIRFLIVCASMAAASIFVGIFLMPHYLAPFTAAFYAIGLQSMRHLRLWKWRGQPVGKTLVRTCVMSCIALSGLRAYAAPLHIDLAKLPSAIWVFEWYGPDHFGTGRADVERRLEQLPGGQLAIVRYSAKHHPGYDWVHNAADISKSKVIWAREMDNASNRELLQYYKDRHAWLIEPDTQSATVSPYPQPEQQTAALR
ncbi:MAG: hypothetical protein KGM96_05295 [Acidobacteriota bacterium]|nr:hypothetical protein [Acidobacteriota bacterium]